MRSVRGSVPTREHRHEGMEASGPMSTANGGVPRGRVGGGTRSVRGSVPTRERRHEGTEASLVRWLA